MLNWFWFSLLTIYLIKKVELPHLCLSSTASMDSHIFTFFHTLQVPHSGWHYWNCEAQTLLREALQRATAEELWDVQEDLPHRNGQENCLHLQDQQRGSLARLLERRNRTLSMNLKRLRISARCHCHVTNMGNPESSDFHTVTLYKRHHFHSSLFSQLFRDSDSSVRR